MPELYNPQKKEAFLNSCFQSGFSASKCRYLFSRLRPYEERWGTDVSAVDATQLKEALDAMAGPRLESQRATLCFLRLYVDWCRSSGDVSVSDAVSQIRLKDIDGAGKLRQTLPSCPAHLQQCLDEVFEPVSEHTVDVTYRCYFWLAYSGLSEEDAFCVCGGDLDFDTMAIRFGGVEYPLYPQAEQALRVAAKFTSFKYRHPQYKADFVIRDRAFGETLLRGFRDRSEKAAAQSFRRMVTRAVKEAIEEGSASVRLSYSRVWLSGLYWRSYEQETMADQPDFGEAADCILLRREDRNNLSDQRRLIAIRNYKADYKRWKTAWGFGAGKA